MRKYKVEQTPSGNWIVSMRLSVLDRWRAIGEAASLEAALFRMSLTLQMQGGKVKVIPRRGATYASFPDINEFNAISDSVSLIERIKKLRNIL